MPKTYKDINYSLMHSLQRFEERYNQKISINQYYNLVKQARTFIAQNKNIKSKSVVSNLNVQYVITMELDNKEIWVVFETERDTITTFLPIKSK